MIDQISSLTSNLGGTQSISQARFSAMQAVNAAATVRQTTNFSEILAQVAGQAVETMRAGEATALSGIQGQASVQQVVQAVMSAEQTLQTAIAIRDKVISAYQEISRMAI